MEEGPRGLERKGCRKNAHVQSVAIGMDQVQHPLDSAS